MISSTLVLVVSSVIVLSAVTSILGVFVLLGRKSLLSDMVAHASLPGIVGIFLATSSRHPLLLLCGAIASSAVGIGCMTILEQTTRLKKDTILGIILSTFFGFGLVLMTVAQRSPIIHKVQFHKILFGALATVIPADIYVLAGMAALVLACLALFWKEFVLVTFDQPYAATLGYPVQRVRNLLMLLILCTVITGLQTVGIMLMSSMLIAPAAAAYQWCTRLTTLTSLACVIGISSGVIGALVSCSRDVPTGPTIVIMLNLMVVFSVIFGKERGIVTRELF